jgi:hypothetical protein
MLFAGRFLEGVSFESGVNEEGVGFEGGFEDAPFLI